MARKEKVPKTYKVKSKSLTKNINQSVHDPAFFKQLSQKEKNQVLAAIQGTPDFKKLYGSLNPSDKQYVDLNIGSPAPREAGVFRGKPEHYEKISHLTPEQSRAAYTFLEQTIPEAFLPENATPEQIAAAKQQGLSGTLSALEKPYESPLNTQLNQMFGHIANPVLQNFLNPYSGVPKAQVLYPSQLNQQVNPAFENLFGQLAQQYAPQALGYAAQNAPAALEALGSLGAQGLNYGKQGLQSAYQAASPYAQDAYQGAQDYYGYGKAMSEGIANDIGSLLGGIGGFGSKLGRAASRVPGAMYRDLNSLLSNLGNYIPKRGQS